MGLPRIGEDRPRRAEIAANRPRYAEETDLECSSAPSPHTTPIASANSAENLAAASPTSVPDTPCAA
eukprot:879211-Rhodomonas_salina.1